MDRAVPIEPPSATAARARRVALQAKALVLASRRTLETSAFKLDRTRALLPSLPEAAPPRQPTPPPAGPSVPAPWWEAEPVYGLAHETLLEAEETRWHLEQTREKAWRLCTQAKELVTAGAERDARLHARMEEAHRKVAAVREAKLAVRAAVEASAAETAPFVSRAARIDRQWRIDWALRWSNASRNEV